MKLNIGEEQRCEKCKRTILAAEVKAMVSDLWLCTECWKAWDELRGSIMLKALKGFVEGGSA